MTPINALPTLDFFGAIGHMASARGKDKTGMPGADGRRTRKNEMSNSKPFDRRDFAGKYSDNQIKYISVGWNAAMRAMAASEQELLRECHLSGQMSAAQSVAHSVDWTLQTK